MICVLLYTRVTQKVLSFTQFLDLLHTFHLCMSLTSTEIWTEIRINFSTVIRGVKKNVQL